jgi:hypothetical protein
MEEDIVMLGAAGSSSSGGLIGYGSMTTPMAPPSGSPWHQRQLYQGLGSAAQVHRLLADATQSSSVYHQPEGGILSGHGVLDDTLSLFMVQVRLVRLVRVVWCWLT